MDKHKHTVNLATGNVPPLPGAPHPAGRNVPSVAPLISFQPSCLLMESQRPGCLSPDDDMPPAASSNHHTVYCCQQPGDKQQHLGGRSSSSDNDCVLRVFTFTSSQTANSVRKHEFQFSLLCTSDFLHEAKYLVHTVR